MSSFNYEQYQNSLAKSATKSNQKVGFFKLANDGDQALVRLACSSMADIGFETIHTIKTADGKWMRVSCQNPFDSNEYNQCPLCAAAAAGNTNIDVARKKIFIKMLVAYKDKVTGGWSQAVPVVWERPSGFSREIAAKITNFGDLKQHIFTVTRFGAAGDTGTTYSLEYIPIFDKPEYVPADFSAFDGFDLSKHSYWKKSIADINVFLQSGVFPGNQAVNTQQQQSVRPAAPQVQQPVTPNYNEIKQVYTPPVMQVVTAPSVQTPVQESVVLSQEQPAGAEVTVQAPTQAAAQTNEQPSVAPGTIRPVRNWSF